VENALPPAARELAAAAGGGERGRGADDSSDQEGARTPEPIVAVHGTIVPVQIATLGDVMLDVIVRLEQPLAHGDDVRAQTRTGAGGQAANVAAWASSLGASARCIAKRGDDATGELVARELAGHGVELVGPVVAGATGVVVAVVGNDGDRSMASDRGVAPYLAPDELDAAWLECDVLHLSGYALLRDPVSAAALLAARLARDRGARISVDVAAWTEIRAYGPVQFRELLDTIAPDVLFATEAEWEMLGGAYLTAPTGVIKRGARGCIVVTEDARLDLAPVEAEVVDTTGAGDALAAGFLIGGSLEEAARRGLEAAARCVARVGSLP
jgi:ribokinase